MSESRIAVQKEDIDILTVTEPYSKGGKICGLPSGAVLKYNESPNPMATICVATGKASMVYLDHLSTSHTCVAEISTAGAVFILIAQYYQHAHPIEPYLRELDEGLVVCSDAWPTSHNYDRFQRKTPAQGIANS